MTKAGLFGVVSFTVIFALLFTQSISYQQADFDGAYLLKQQHRSRYFDFYCTDQDISALPELSILLETNIRLIRRDLQSDSRESIIVEIYPNLDAFHLAIGRPDSPDWAAGYGGNGKIQIVSPLNPGSYHSFDTILKIAVHEMTHVITARMFTQRIPTWLNEGIALYASQTAENIHDALMQDINNDLIPTFADLDITVDSTKDIADFVKNNGYEYSYTIVEFIVKQYGYDSLAKLLRAPQDHVGILNLTEEEFYGKWIGYLKQTYGARPSSK